MSALAAPARPGAMSGVNPVARLGAALVLAIGLLLSIDPVSAAVALLLVLALVPLTGIGWRRFWRRSALIWIAAPLAAVTIALYGQASGAVHWQWGPVLVTDGSLLLALATGLRVLALALPAVVLFADVDPTELADGLAQVLHLPARFVIGSLAAVRMLGLLRDDWRATGLARRARGVSDRGRIRRAGGQAFAVLVVALRRGSSLATAMEARGFGGTIPRTWARDSRFGAREWALIAVAAAIAALAIGAAVVTGSWRFIGG